MKHLYWYSSLLFSMAIGLCSCHQTKENSFAGNDIEFQTIRSDKKYHINNDSTQPFCNLNINFIYPLSFKEKAAQLDSLQRIFIYCFFDEEFVGKSPEEVIQEYENNYIKRYQEDFKIYSEDRFLEHDATDTYASYSESDSSVIKFNKANLLSFQVIQTTFKGGATSYEFRENHVVDLKSLKLLVEEDLFKSGFQDHFAQLFCDALLEKENVSTIEELENTGYFGLDEMYPNNNFLLDDKGITYIFNKGEYSGYKMDAIKLFIPYTEIKNLIKEGSPIFKFIL